MMIFFAFLYLIIIGMLVSAAGGLISLSAGGAAVLIIFIYAVSVLLYVILSKKKKVKVTKESFLCIKTPLDAVFAVVFVLLFVFEVLGVILYGAKDPAVFKDIGAATYVYDTGRLSNASPLMNLYGVTAYIMKIHPLELIFTVFPAPFLAFYYLGYYELIKKLCDDKRLVHPAMCFAAVLNIWGYYCRPLLGITILMSWYDMGAIVVHALFVAIAILLYTYSGRIKFLSAKAVDEETPAGEEDEDYLEEWDMKKHKIINARNLAIALGAVVILLIAVTLIMNRKINDLYAATVNLQDDMNSRCSVYEFTGSDGEVAGYLLKGSDGNLTMIGGGDISCADALSEFITKHGTSVSNWYIYSNSDEDTGALNAILSGNSINVDAVYLLGREDISEYLK